MAREDDEEKTYSLLPGETISQMLDRIEREEKEEKRRRGQIQEEPPQPAPTPPPGQVSGAANDFSWIDMKLSEYQKRTEKVKPGSQRREDEREAAKKRKEKIKLFEKTYTPPAPGDDPVESATRSPKTGAEFFRFRPNKVYAEQWWPGKDSVLDGDATHPELRIVFGDYAAHDRMGVEAPSPAKAPEWYYIQNGPSRPGFWASTARIPGSLPFEQRVKGEVVATIRRRGSETMATIRTRPLDPAVFVPKSEQIHPYDPLPIDSDPFLLELAEWYRALSGWKTLVPVNGASLMINGTPHFLVPGDWVVKGMSLRGEVELCVLSDSNFRRLYCFDAGHKPETANMFRKLMQSYVFRPLKKTNRVKDKKRVKMSKRTMEALGFFDEPPPVPNPEKPYDESDVSNSELNG